MAMIKILFDFTKIANHLNKRRGLSCVQCSAREEVISKSFGLAEFVQIHKKGSPLKSKPYEEVKSV